MRSDGWDCWDSFFYSAHTRDLNCRNKPPNHLSVPTVPGDDMHSHDRTLLAKLGFNDSDRKAPEHDSACRYLAYEVYEHVFRKVFDMKPEAPPEGHRWFKGSTEVHLVKGQDQYATTIGFADVVIKGYTWDDCEIEDQKGRHHEMRSHRRMTRFVRSSFIRDLVLSNTKNSIRRF
jgi:hypothetical protein